MKKKLIVLLQQQISLLRQLIKLQSMRTLTQVILSKIGTDASPHDLAPDELGCAETVTTVKREHDGITPVMIGTWSLYVYMEHPANGWERIEEPEEECIVISPTGLGKKGTNGHVGFVIRLNGELVIVSNDSRTGKFLQNFSINRWLSYFGALGYPTFYYRKKK